MLQAAAVCGGTASCAAPAPRAASPRPLRKARWDSLLVMTGVTTVTELLNAPAEHRPTYLACDLRGLLDPHPEVVVDAIGARCGDWLARRRDGARAEVELIGDGPAFDGLRAVLALSWSADDAGEELLDAARALDRLDVG